MRLKTRKKEEKFMMIIGFLLIGYLAYTMIKDRNTKFTKNNSVVETLNERYISGEIDEESYFRIKKNLNL